MYTTKDIESLKNMVIEIVNPDKIVLFGSYAYGEPSDKSDIDLLVIKNGNTMKDITLDDEVKFDVQLFNERILRGIDIRFDIFYRTDKQVMETARKGGAFVDAINKGVVIYERFDN